MCGLNAEQIHKQHFRTTNKTFVAFSLFSCGNISLVCDYLLHGSFTSGADSQLFSNGNRFAYHINILSDCTIHIDTTM